MYNHDFNKVCSLAPFSVVLAHLQIPFKREGKTLKTDDIVVTEGAVKRAGYYYDAFFFKADKKGTSIIDFIQKHFNYKYKMDACKWIETNILGENEQKDDIKPLELVFDPLLAEFGLTDSFCKHNNIGIPTKKTGVMKERLCFPLVDRNYQPRGYIGYDWKKAYKLEWYVPKGTKTADMLYNIEKFNGNRDYCILAQNPLDACVLVGLGFSYTLGMLGAFLTKEQIAFMSTFRRILLFHSKPDEIAMKLCANSFVKAVQWHTAIGKTSDDVKACF